MSEVMFILLISVLFVHLLSKAHFCMLMACCILHFEKAENFVKYTVIYFIQLHVSTLLQIIFAPNFFCGSSFLVSRKVEALYDTINARLVPCMIELLGS